ncbi:hypothetical protein Tco_1482329 [Tanacetum coccineum]
MIEANRLLAERLQSKEREELTDEEKGKLFMELIEKRRKHFAALRAQEKRNIPPTKAQKRTQMSTYLKHMGTKRKEKKVECSEETAKGSRKKMLGRKRAGKEQQQESSKKQKVKKEKESDEVEEVDEDDEAELKKLFLVKEGVMIHYQLIRADGSSKRYSSMIRMLHGIVRRRLGKQLWWTLNAKRDGDLKG